MHTSVRVRRVVSVVEMRAALSAVFFFVSSSRALNTMNQCWFSAHYKKNVLDEYKGACEGGGGGWSGVGVGWGGGWNVVCSACTCSRRDSMY
jgi:hypothetical protein